MATRLSGLAPQVFLLLPRDSYRTPGIPRASCGLLVWRPSSVACYRGNETGYPKGFALCRQPLLDAQDQSERVELEILRILPQEMARDLDSGAKICSATFW